MRRVWNSNLKCGGPRELFGWTRIEQVNDVATGRDSARQSHHRAARYGEPRSVCAVTAAERTCGREQFHPTEAALHRNLAINTFGRVVVPCLQRDKTKRREAREQLVLVGKTRRVSERVA